MDQDQLSPDVAYEGHIVRVPHNPRGGGGLLKRNTELDALRAISILLVLIAHLGYQHIVPGGLGVTIFFGISGYIITALILKEHQDYGNVDLFLFYRRRFWKIAPPLFFLVVIPSLLTWKVYSISIEKFLSQLFFFSTGLKSITHPEMSFLHQEWYGASQ
jgi:peptidoglycan/LPS O-acetylase OafA/YrhL